MGLELGGLSSLFGLIRRPPRVNRMPNYFFFKNLQKAKISCLKWNTNRYRWDLKTRFIPFFLKFDFRWHHHKMREIIYHNIVYQYLHTRTQHKSDMVPEKIQFSIRTMKIMFRFSLGKILLSKASSLFGMWGSIQSYVKQMSHWFDFSTMIKWIEFISIQIT